MSRLVSISYDGNCTTLDKETVENRMKKARPCSYKRLVSTIKNQIPWLYTYLALDVPNPYYKHCRQTKDYYILVHSAIEYFIKKER